MTKQQNYVPWPLDFAILEHMPEKALIGGVHWQGISVKNLSRAVSNTAGIQVTSSQVNSRVRALREDGDVEMFSATGGKIWARTPKGTHLLSKKEEYLGSQA